MNLLTSKILRATREKRFSKKDNSYLKLLIRKICKPEDSEEICRILHQGKMSFKNEGKITHFHTIGNAVN